MDTALTQEHRQVVWKELERIESQLQRKDEWPSNYVAKKLVEHFDKQPDIFERYKNDYILVDEYQDIPPIKLKLLKHLARKAIYLAGDVNQSIYKRPYYSFAEIGIDISGRSRILTESFRNTYQINAVAQKYKELAGIADIEENMTSSRSGLPVKLFSGSTDECIDTINKVTRNLVYLGTNPKDICIVVYSNDQVNKVIKHFSKADDGDDNLDIEIINTENSDSFFDNNSIKISTIHSIKGLEFPNILFLADYDLHQSIIRGKNTSEIELLEKYLIYVAITRANSFLYVFSNKGKENKYKANIALINAINETNSVYN
jgi:superfamily I DNA/RNA helicase